MKTIAIPIIVLPFILHYLAGVMVALKWNPMDWPLAVQITVGIIALINILFWIFVWLVSRTFRLSE